MSNSMFDNSCLGSCSPIQILNIDMAVNDADDVKVYDMCDVEYSMSQLKYAYSVDGVCWSCYMTYEDIVSNTINEISDFFIRLKVPGEIGKVEVNGEETTDYTTALDSELQLTSYCDTQNNYNPYINMDNAIQLQQALSDQVVCTIGIPVYYFKASGNANSADMTFKEYALKKIDSVKQIKLVIGDGQMPSSKPEFAEIGLDWQTDWQTEISKSMFATAFGINAQPMEGDLVYIPMMKRMWMVNEAYDERNGALMWQSTTWQVFLTKYQADASMDLNVHEDFVDSLVKNKYEDLFGDSEPLDSGMESTTLTTSRPANMYSVYQSDATRKYMTCDTINFQQTALYHRGTLVMDNCYSFLPSIGDASIVYQRPYCGTDGSLSFIIRCTVGNIYEGTLFKLGHISFNVSQSNDNSYITCNVIDDKKLTLKNNEWYYIQVRWSKSLHTFDMMAAHYTYPDGIPIYKLTNYHYIFDINGAQQQVGKWNTELQISDKTEFTAFGFYGNISNIKMMDVYDQNTSELMMQYPTNAHLLINDTARPLVGLTGVSQQ